MSTKTQFFTVEQFPLLGSLQERGALEQLKNWAKNDLEKLAQELRVAIIKAVDLRGGHLASNLGVVELTIALHSCFDALREPLIWDVGHQSYAHKMLTGRLEEFCSLRTQDGLSGFPRRAESNYDWFNTGHSSTAISAAFGILHAQRLQELDNKVVAIVGDGAITAGMAFEALNHAGFASNDLIVILNDNKMSIAHNVGAISRLLSRLVVTSPYTYFRKKINKTLLSIPLFGRSIFFMIEKLKKSIKSLFYRQSLFSDLGFKYIGPLDGHNIPMLKKNLNRVKKLDEPVLMHVVTQKGHGDKESEDSPDKFHGLAPPRPNSESSIKLEANPPQSIQEGSSSYTEVFSSKLLELVISDQSMVAISAAMPGSTGLAPIEKNFPKRFHDVGIAEQHAMTFAAGLAVGGALPVIAIYSTFTQRCIDQIIHDVTLQKLHIILCMDRCGLVPGDGETHQGIFDITLLRSIPNLFLLSPGGIDDFKLLLDFAHSFDSCMVIRYPKRSCPKIKSKQEVVVLGQGQLYSAQNLSTMAAPRQVKDILFCTGSLLFEALSVQELLAADGIFIDVYHLQFLNNWDLAHYHELLIAYDRVFSIEDGILEGGVGQALLYMLQELSCRNNTPIQPVYIKAINNKLPMQGTYNELLKQVGLDIESLLAWHRELVL